MFEAKTRKGSRVTPKTADRIDREDDVGGLDDGQHQEERGGVDASRKPDEKALAVVLQGDRYETPYQMHHRVLLGMDLGVLLQQELDSGHHQEGTEDEDCPLEAGDERRAGEDERGTQHQRPEDPPEEHPGASLSSGRHGEVAEDHQEDEQVVDERAYSIR